MMRIVAGIDFEHYPLALAFLERLRFSAAGVRLMHVIESLFPDKSFPDLGPTHPLSILMAENERQAHVELENAKMLLQVSGYRLETEIQRGDPARKLVEYAKDSSAEIIAVGSASKGAWASLFFGSVTKALTAGAEQSILVAKSRPRSPNGLSAVLAVDHSDYCNACIERLIEWGPQGVHRVTVVTARQADFDLDQHIDTDLETQNAKVCNRLSALGIECDHRIVQGHPNEAIGAVMKDTEADLLIMGARGHGFWDRLRLGSVSHFQVVATPHNVLVVRV